MVKQFLHWKLLLRLNTQDKWSLRPNNFDINGPLKGYNFIQIHLISFNFFKKQYAHSRTRYAFSNQIETKQEIENINKESQTKKTGKLDRKKRQERKGYRNKEKSKLRKQKKNTQKRK